MSQPPRAPAPAPAPAHGSAGLRVRRWAGALLILAGLGVLGHVGWQMYVTTLIARAEHAETVDALRREWKRSPEPVRVDAGTATAILRIPRFGADFEVPILSGTSDRVLAAGVGHFSGGAGPGEAGNFALAGHRITHGEPFQDLPALQPGDEVVVETASRTYTYVLDTGGDDLTVPFTSTWVVDRRPRNPEPGGIGPKKAEERLLTLTTCSELFHTDNRLVAFGHLTDVRRR